jgi:hypothetical protein
MGADVQEADASNQQEEVPMSRFRLDDVSSLENAPTSAATLRAKVGEMILNSTAVRAHVEVANPQTGEYRIVLQGTLDKEEHRFE